MACHSTGDVPGADQESDTSSEYGSDFTPEEEDLLNELLSKISTKPSAVVHRVDRDGAFGSTQTYGILRQRPWPDSYKSKLEGEVEVFVEGSGDSAQRDGTRTRGYSMAIRPEADFKANDARSPLERFRTPPKKALSVTDLVSPAWCELQYFYALVKHGRVRRTSVMKRGSVVHKDLEEQVHKTVPVDVATTEDAWGLRFWNVIQGLRTLRVTGMTRELEVWGLVDGLLVNGVIDEISFVCPDENLEAEELPNKGSAKNTAAQRSLVTNFVTLSGTNSGDGVLGKGRVPSRKVYLTDVKTRKRESLPNGASFRPTLFQLMLYHRFFSDLVSDRFDADILFRRYKVDPSANFSDSFISQIAALGGYSYNGGATSPNIERCGPEGGQDPLDLLLENNSVGRLWRLMIREFQRAVPAGAEGVGVVLKVEYRSQTDGSVFGQKTFLHKDEVLDEYLADEMMWWRGKREARGVSIEEAYKCQSCEFASDCKWRIAKIEESTQNYRKKRSGSEQG
ncbi:MAG: hypothetical protein M1813_008352 [Trichoglossum hirsutum]|nr:MAG: hypothetical protein M1813_008352 [Trichoglossum hirsutum]